MCLHTRLHDPPRSQVDLALNFGHSLLCRDGTPEAIYRRHTYITDALRDLIQHCNSANGPLPVNQLNREVDVGFRANGSVIKADIVHVENFDQPGAIKFVFDVTIVEPNNRHGIHRAEVGAAVEAAAADKNADYSPVILQPNTKFVPFALDSNGHFGKHATAYLNRLKIGNPAAGPRIKHFVQEVSYQLAKQTAIAAEAARAAAYQAVWNRHP